MNLRLSVVGTLLALVAAGCRPADPLAWRIDARTPNHYNAWQQEHLPQLPDDVRREFVHAFHLLAALDPAGAAPENMNAANNPLCQRLHRRTVRDVILEGYHLESRALLGKISTTSDNLLRNVARSAEAADRATEQRFERVQREQESAIETMNRRLEAIRRRVGELSAGPPR